jgi:hypothetical protein
MSAGNLPIHIDQGSEYSDEFTISEDGAPIDFTGYLARSQARSTKTSSTVAFTFESSINADGTTGKIDHVLAGLDSANVPAGEYYWDIETYKPGEVDVNRWLEGVVTISQRTTQPV